MGTYKKERLAIAEAMVLELLSDKNQKIISWRKDILDKYYNKVAELDFNKPAMETLRRDKEDVQKKVRKTYPEFEFDKACSTSSTKKLPLELRSTLYQIDIGRLDHSVTIFKRKEISITENQRIILDYQNNLTNNDHLHIYLLFKNNNGQINYIADRINRDLRNKGLLYINTLFSGIRITTKITDSNADISKLITYISDLFYIS